MYAELKLDSFRFNTTDISGLNFLHTPNQVFDEFYWSPELKLELMDYRREEQNQGKAIAGADGYGTVYYYKNYLQIGDYKIILPEPLTKTLSGNDRLENPLEQLFWNNWDQYDGYLAESKDYIYLIEQDLLQLSWAYNNQSRVILRRMEKAKDFKKLNYPKLSFKVEDKDRKVREIASFVFDESYEPILQAEIGGEEIYRKGDFLYLTRTPVFSNIPILQVPIDWKSFKITREKYDFTIEDKDYFYEIINHGRFQYEEIRRIKK